MLGTVGAVLIGDLPGELCYVSVVFPNVEGQGAGLGQL